MDANTNQFTYIATAANLPIVSAGTASTVAGKRVYSRELRRIGTGPTNAGDGCSPTPLTRVISTGTDTFAYQAVDALSNTASAVATVTIYVGGYLSIPQNLTVGGITSTVAVPVNIASPNPANSQGLADATFGINYDPTVFTAFAGGSPNVAKGALNSGANWTNFTVNVKRDPNTGAELGQIVFTTGHRGPRPQRSIAGGSLAIITFTVVGLPTNNTSSCQPSASSPTTTELDVAGLGNSGNAIPLPFAIQPLDNTNFNGLPGSTDGLISFPGAPAPVNTTLTVSATANGSAASIVTYGTEVTLTATVAPTAGNTVPTAGSVDFHDGTTDLGNISLETVSGNNAIFTLITGVNQLPVLQAAGGIQNITATYADGTGFTGISGTLAGGLQVTPAPLTITATTNTKTYDATNMAAAILIVSGLVGTDTLPSLAEAYAGANAGSSKTLSVISYSVNDGNGGRKLHRGHREQRDGDD